MHEERRNIGSASYDAIIIGAGICGIIFLEYARKKGLDCLVLEKQSSVGGLWNWLPLWQDIQNRKSDFSINHVPLRGVTQPDLKQHVNEWVQKFQLEPFIKLNCEVTSVSWFDNKWKIRTKENIFSAKYLIVASGVQNEPWIPEVDRSNTDIREMHSSALQQPEILTNKKVTIVGGGSSGWDLLDLAIKNRAKDVDWVYRSIRWFLPTTRTKQTAWPNLRELSMIQSFKKSTAGVNSFLRWLLRNKYKSLHLKEIMPEEPFDIRKHQLIPGRSVMLKNLDSISRHQSEIKKIQGGEIKLKNGENLQSDVIIWATGYRMNLEYLDLPEYKNIKTPGELKPKLGSLTRSIDYPNLFFIGMSLIESTSATPFFAAIESKSIVAHILGKCEIPRKNISHHISHWDLFRFFAAFDHFNYPGFWWKIKYFSLAWVYLLFPNKSIKI